MRVISLSLILIIASCAKQSSTYTIDLGGMKLQCEGDSSFFQSMKNHSVLWDSGSENNSCFINIVSYDTNHVTQISYHPMSKPEEDGLAFTVRYMKELYLNRPDTVFTNQLPGKMKYLIVTPGSAQNDSAILFIKEHGVIFVSPYSFPSNIFQYFKTEAVQGIACMPNFCIQGSHTFPANRKNQDNEQME